MGKHVRHPEINLYRNDSPAQNKTSPLVVFDLLCAVVLQLYCSCTAADVFVLTAVQLVSFNPRYSIFTGSGSSVKQPLPRFPGCVFGSQSDTLCDCTSYKQVCNLKKKRLLFPSSGAAQMSLGPTDRK